ncbi:hypothetical protein D3C87_2063270 [compost metagenome]
MRGEDDLISALGQDLERSANLFDREWMEIELRLVNEKQSVSGVLLDGTTSNFRKMTD